MVTHWYRAPAEVKGRPHIFVHKNMYEHWVELLKKPRVFKEKDQPQMMHGVFQTRRPNLQTLGLVAFSSFFEEFPPKGFSQRHGHMNGAVFYILRGKGYEVHDGERFPWEAGDLVIIPPSCVHRHVNDDPDEHATAIVFVDHPLYLFLNLAAGRVVDMPGEGSI